MRVEERIATTRGPFVLRWHAHAATVGVHVAMPFDRRWFALALDLARPSLRTHEYEEGRGDWLEAVNACLGASSRPR